LKEKNVMIYDITTLISREPSVPGGVDEQPTKIKRILSTL
jgi:hypothetical protein